MKERPILFSATMVRALLDGSKTQTRRIVKPAGAHTIFPFIGRDDKPTGEFAWCPSQSYITKHIFCPYGQPGDRLWVRESFWGCDMPGYGDTPCVVYDDEWQGKEYAPAEVRPYAPKFGRIPSIHMPRELSRITLEITGVRVERLNDCSDADALAEGVDRTNTSISGYAQERYRRLWESINGEKSWDANPWVWVIEFRRLTA